MPRLKFALVLMAATAGLLSAPARGAEPAQPILGVWRNPKNSVHVDIRPCGQSTCGYVVWATAKAEAAARKHGTERLVGLQILRDFTPADDGTWRGKVFAPDLGMTFSGRANVIDATSLWAKGCVLGRILCKSQVWKRIDGAAAP